MATATKQNGNAALLFTEQEQLTVLLIGCRHAEAVIALAEGPSAPRSPSHPAPWAVVLFLLCRFSACREPCGY